MNEKGISVIYRDPAGQHISYIFNYYACGIDMLNVAYHYLDLVPKGRDEDSFDFSMAWLRRRERVRRAARRSPCSSGRNCWTTADLHGGVSIWRCHPREERRSPGEPLRRLP